MQFIYNQHDINNNKKKGLTFRGEIQTELLVILIIKVSRDEI